ncbi:unnamed protein product [Caenorhabditis angaria]|uniref:Sdz-33 F-box domain-containing protein n=1 Tax=Caenorhabditis angaria TaxID=860376 RepID=A0A9P1I880_9PELO|nr:unnamed protein product [Caenorhabditis angaria]
MAPSRKRKAVESSSTAAEKPTEWKSLPETVRKNIVDLMDAKTRCLFSTCSKSSTTEALQSKNYVYGIEVNNKYENVIGIRVFHEEDKISYMIWFRKIRENNTEIMYFVKTDGEEEDESDSDDEEDDDELEDQDKDLGLVWICWTNSDQVSNLSKINVMEEFPFFGEFNLLNTKNLEKVSILCDEQGDDLLWHECVTVDMLSKIPKLIELHDAKLRFHELLKLKADKIALYPSEFSTEDINQYLKKWVNGEIHENLRKLHLKIHHFVLDNKKLVDGLKVYNFHEYPYVMMKFALRSPARPGKIAKIHNTQHNFFIHICDDINPPAVEDYGTVPDVFDEDSVDHIARVLNNARGDQGDSDEDEDEEDFEEEDGHCKLLEYFEDSDEEFDRFGVSYV